MELAFRNEHGAYKNQDDFEKAIMKVMNAAKIGYADAQYELAKIYLNEDGVDQNFQVAIYWLKEAAKRKHGAALCKLAHMYLNGEGVTKDLEGAAYMFDKAMNNGSLDAQYFLAYMNLIGIGLTKNIKNGLKLLESAAYKGHEKSQFQLARQYAEGVFCDKDLHKATFWFDKLARKGHTRAPKLLADTLFSKWKNREGDIEDLKAAAYWLKKVLDHSDLLEQALVFLKSVDHEMPNDYEPEPITMNVSTVDASAEIEVEPEVFTKQKEEKAALVAAQTKLQNRLKSIEEACTDKPNELKLKPRGTLKNTPIMAVLSEKYANFQRLVKQCKTAVNQLKYNDLKVGLHRIEKDMDRLEALKSDIEVFVLKLSVYRSYFEQLNTLSFPVSHLTDDEKKEKESLQDEILKFKQLDSLVSLIIQNPINQLFMDSDTFIKKVESRLKLEQSTRDLKSKQQSSGAEKKGKGPADKGKFPTRKGKGQANSITCAQFKARKSLSTSASAANSSAELTSRADEVRNLVGLVQDRLKQDPTRDNAIYSFYALQQIIADLTEESRWSLRGAARKEATATRHASHHGHLMILDEQQLKQELLSSFIKTLNFVCVSLQGQPVDFNAVSGRFEQLKGFCLNLENEAFDLKLQTLCASFRTVCLGIDSQIRAFCRKWTTKTDEETAKMTIDGYVPLQKEALTRLLVMIDNCINKESENSIKSREELKSFVYSKLEFSKELNIAQHRRNRAHRGKRDVSSIGFDSKTILEFVTIGSSKGYEQKIRELSNPR